MSSPAAKLHDRLQTLGIPSLRQLAKRSGVSRSTWDHLRRGQIMAVSLGKVQKMAQALDFSLPEFLNWLDPDLTLGVLPSPRQDDRSTPEPPTPDRLALLEQEYQHLQRQLTQQAETLRLGLERQNLQQLESWLRQWPRVVHAIRTDKPNLPVAQVLPLLRGLESLVQSWGLEPIGQIGDRLPYTPQTHQLTGGVTVEPGTWVEILRPGYSHRGDLLCRAEVIPLALVKET